MAEDSDVDVQRATRRLDAVHHGPALTELFVAHDYFFYNIMRAAFWRESWTPYREMAARESAAGASKLDDMASAMELSQTSTAYDPYVEPAAETADDFEQRQLDERSYERPPNDRPPHYLELKDDPKPVAGLKARRSKSKPKCTLLVKPFGGQVFTECGKRGCDITCANPTPNCTQLDECTPRCECPPHMPLLYNGRCVATDACPKASALPATSLEASSTSSEGGIYISLGGGVAGALAAALFVLAFRRARALRTMLRPWPRASLHEARASLHEADKGDSPVVNAI